MMFAWREGYRLFIALFFYGSENFGDKKHDEYQHDCENAFPYFIEENSGDTADKGECIYWTANEIMRESEIHEAEMKMVNHVSLERIFLVIESYENDIECIDDIHSENTCYRGNFSTRDDSQSGDHEGEKHTSTISREEKFSGVIETPKDNNWRQKNGEDEKNELRIFLWSKSVVGEIEFGSQHSDDKEGDSSKTRGHTRHRIAPIERVHDENIPDDGEEERDNIHGYSENIKLEVIEIDNASKNIANISDFYTSNTNERSDSYLHDESKKRRDTNRTFAKNMEPIQNTNSNYDSSANENDDEFFIGKVSQCER